MTHLTNTKAYASVSAKVIRANGTIEDLGIISTTKIDEERKTFWRRVLRWLTTPEKNNKN